MARPYHWMIALALVGALASPDVSAQTQSPNPGPNPSQTAPASPDQPAPAPKLETSPEGSYLRLAEPWPQDRETATGAFVDRRGEVDAMAHTAILWPTAFTPKQGTLTYTNFFLIGNTLSYAITDDQQLGITAVLPTLGAFHTQATYRIRLDDGPNHIVTLIPVVHYQTEGDSTEVTTSAISAGGGVVADFYLSDDFVVGVGAHFQATLAASTGGIVENDCPDRDAFRNGDCSRFERQWTSLPAGGHWLALVGHATYYVSDWLNLRAELFTGGVFGSFLGTEYLYGRERLPERSQRYEDGEFALGIPYDSQITAGLGTGLTFGSLAIQLSGYMYYWDESVRLTPMFSASFAF